VIEESESLRKRRNKKKVRSQAKESNQRWKEPRSSRWNNPRTAAHGLRALSDKQLACHAGSAHRSRRSQARFRRFSEAIVRIRAPSDGNPVAMRTSLRNFFRTSPRPDFKEPRSCASTAHARRGRSAGSCGLFAHDAGCSAHRTDEGRADDWGSVRLPSSAASAPLPPFRCGGSQLAAFLNRTLAAVRHSSGP
jgi:hypothetical protein